MGESSVGKTLLVHKFIDDESTEDFKATIGADFFTKTFKINDSEVDVQIWDTAGEERFHSISSSFYRGTDACILVYDLTNKASFNKLEVWLNDLKEKADIDNIENFSLMVFGNKLDLAENSRDVSIESGQNWAREHNCLFMEVSAKTQENVSKGFDELLCHFLENRVEKADVTQFSLKIVKETGKEKKNDSCC